MKKSIIQFVIALTLTFCCAFAQAQSIEKQVIPNLLMGTTVTSVVQQTDFSVGLSHTASFGNFIAFLDDIDNNGVREYVISSGHYVSGPTATSDEGYRPIYIAFPDTDGTILKFQDINPNDYIGEEWLHVWPNDISDMRPAHDFDGNGVSDIVVGMSTLQSLTSSGGAIAKILFEDGVAPETYAIKDVLTDSNATTTLLPNLTSGHLGSNVDVIGDLDGNGAMDYFATASDGAYKLRGSNTNVPWFILYSNTDGSLLDYEQLDSPSVYAHVAKVFGDFDGDGVQDIVSHHGSVNGLSHPPAITLLNANGTLGLTTPIDIGIQMQAIYQFSPIGDIDGDGVLDFAFSGIENSGDVTQGIFIVKMNADYSVKELVQFDYNDLGLDANIRNNTPVFEDMDADGDLDIVIRDTTNNSIATIFLDGAPVPGPIEIARVTVSADGTTLTNVSGDVDIDPIKGYYPTGADAGNVTRNRYAWNLNAWLIKMNNILPGTVADYYLESVTPGMYIHRNAAGQTYDTWYVSDYGGNSAFAFQCVSDLANANAHVGCEGITVRLMKN